MSMLDVACARCEKKFRVRAEFAGRSTRCPGCSAPITIAGLARPAAPPRHVDEERARPRPRPRDDDDDEPRRPEPNWQPVETAFRREQTAIVFALLGIVGSFLSFCLSQSFARSGDSEPVVIFVVLLFSIGPALATAAFAVMARSSALAAPKETRSRGSAMSSMLCSLACLACLLGFALSLLMSMDGQGRDPLPMIVATGGLILSTLGSWVTFVGFVAQIGIARRSAEVSRRVARISITIAVCVLALLGIGTLYTLASEIRGPSYGYGAVYYDRDHSTFAQIVLAILFPLAFGVLLVLYHRLLAAGRQAVSQAIPGDND